MNDGTGLAEALLGLSRFRVLEVEEDDLELVVDIETLADFVGCSECGTGAEAHDRIEGWDRYRAAGVAVVDLLTGERVT